MHHWTSRKPTNNSKSRYQNQTIPIETLEKDVKYAES